MKNFFNHSKKYIFRGIIALIPLMLTYIIVRFLYVTIDQRVMGMVQDAIGYSIPGLGILLVAIILYITGIVTSNVVGTRVLKTIENITERIPIVGTVYNIGRQLSATLSLPEKQVFKRAVLVEFLHKDVWTLGFVTGSLIDRQNNNQKLLKIYVPTPPNPTSGFILFAREDQIRNPGWSVEAALKLTISCGILGPEEIIDRTPNRGEPLPQPKPGDNVSKG